MKIAATMLLSHINTRQEKHGPDEKVLVLDLKFKKTLPLDSLSPLLPPEFQKAVAGFYDKKGATEVNGLELKPPIQGVEMDVTVKEDLPSVRTDIRFGQCKLDKISITLSPEKIVDLSFRIIVYPDKAQHGEIGSLLGKEVLLDANGRQGELDLDKKKDEPEESE